RVSILRLCVSSRPPSLYGLPQGRTIGPFVMELGKVTVMVATEKRALEKVLVKETAREVAEVGELGTLGLCLDLVDQLPPRRLVHSRALASQKYILPDPIHGCFAFETIPAARLLTSLLYAAAWAFIIPRHNVAQR